MPFYHPTRGFPAYSFSGDALPANGTAGIQVGIQRAPGEGARDVQWFTLYGTVPTSVQVSIQRSYDGTTWYPVDTTSDTAGEMKMLRGETAPWLRGVKTASVGGTTLTVGFIV